MLFCFFRIQAQDCNLFDSSNCLKNLENYYYYEEIVLDSDCSNILSNTSKIKLRQGLTQSIVSFIETKSVQNLKSEIIGNKFYEKETFNSLSESNSSAILFNPKFSLCKKIIDGSEINTVSVYVEKKSFNSLALNFFISEITRVNNNLKSYNEYYEKNPSYEFEEEKIKLQVNLKVIGSYYGLVLSISKDQEFMSSYFQLVNSIDNFLRKINSLDNNLIIVDRYLREENFVKSYNLLKTLKNKYPDNKQLDSKINIYNKVVKQEKGNQIKNVREISVASNKFSIGFGFNSSLFNQDLDSELSKDSYWNKMYPFFETKFELNDRDGKIGIGPYYKFNYSKALLKIDESKLDYKFPFSNNFSEFGGFLKVFFPEFNSSLTFNAGKLLENFVTVDGEELNYWTFSPGINIFLKNKNNKSYRSSISIKYNLLSSKNQYSYDSWSFIFYRDIKVGRKISQEDKKKIDNEFKTF